MAGGQDDPLRVGASQGPPLERLDDQAAAVPDAGLDRPGQQRPRQDALVAVVADLQPSGHLAQQ